MAVKLSGKVRSNQRHVVLLGDSIFDNEAYVQPGSVAVIDQVKSQLGPDWKATLCAVDGAVTGDVAQQLRRVPDDATHMIVSVGGNDALRNQEILGKPVNTAFDAFTALSSIQQRFGAVYDRMLARVVACRKPTAVCTIYDPHFPDPDFQRAAVAALSAFNDRITRSAFRRGVPIIDLRLLFTEEADYANPIEPSAEGGLKIANEIKRVVQSHDFRSQQSAVYPAAKQ